MFVCVISKFVLAAFVCCSWPSLFYAYLIIVLSVVKFCWKVGRVVKCCFICEFSLISPLFKLILSPCCVDQSSNSWKFQVVFTALSVHCGFKWNGKSVVFYC